MALNFTHLPPKFTPAYTDGLFYTVSADTNHFKFRYVYDLHVNGVSVFEGKATPNPFNLGIIDLSRILKTYVSNNPISVYEKTPIYTHQTFPFSRPYQDEVINYQLYVGYEYADSEIGQVTGFTGAGVTGDTIGPPSETPGLYKTFKSTMGVNGRANEQDFSIDPFVLSGTPVGTYPTTSGLFLTNSPRIRNIQESEWYTLAFTNYYLTSSVLSEPYYVQYKQYDDQGNLLMTSTFDNISDNGGGPRSGCTDVYQAIYPLFGTGQTEYNTLYVGAGPRNIEPILHNDAVTYTIQLFGKFTGSTSPIQPTPTPTPTPSSTPTSICSGFCQSYTVSNPNLVNCSVEYFNCATNSTTRRFVPAQSSILVQCACSGSFVYECNLVVSSFGDCGVIPPPCNTCYSIAVSNAGSRSATYQYYNCNTQQWTVNTIPSGTSASHSCACPTINNGSEDLTVIVFSQCTPAVSPTPTPTPTPSCPGYIAWNIVTCTNTCQAGLCACVAPEYDTVYTDCTVSDITDSGTNIYTTSALSSPFVGDFQQDGYVWNSTGSDVVLVCTVGGGC